ncbi:MAG TPA: tetratricopeptide repeat protein [Chitinophagaceae bacterium]|nr:tetratricopeptide repeat protein [Chitinophagaceae bacterium]
MKIIRKLILFTWCVSCIHMSLKAQTEAKDFAMADSLVNAGEFQKAIPLFNNLISKYGEKEKFFTGRGFAYSQINELVKSRESYSRGLALNPSCSKCLINLAMLDVLNNDFSRAFIFMDQYIKLEPAQAIGYAKRGELEFQTGKLDEAMADFHKSLQLDSTSPYVYLYLAMTQMAKGSNHEALAAINKSLKYNPDLEFAYFIRGKIYIELGDYRLAINDLFGCLRKNPMVSEYNTYAGIALFYVQDYNKAMQAFDASLKLDSSDHLPFQFRSYLLYSEAAFTKACIDKQRALAIASATGNQAAIKQLQQEMDEYCDLSKPGAHYHTGQILFGQAAFDKAKLAYSNGLRQFPEDPLLLEGRGNTAIVAGQFSEALSYYNQCLAHLKEINTGLLTKEKSPEKKRAANDFFLSQLYNSIAFAHMNLLHLDSATIWMGKAIDVLQKNPAVDGRTITLAEFLVKRSGILRIQKNDAAANADITEALQVNPECSDAYMERARYLINKNTIEGEISKDNMAAIYQPNQPGNNTNFTYITTPAKNWNSKEIEAALKDCNLAISFNPINKEAYMIRAQARILLKKDNYCADILQAKKLGIIDAAKRLNVTCN